MLIKQKSYDVDKIGEKRRLFRLDLLNHHCHFRGFYSLLTFLAFLCRRHHASKLGKAANLKYPSQGKVHSHFHLDGFCKKRTRNTITLSLSMLGMEALPSNIDNFRKVHKAFALSLKWIR